MLFRSTADIAVKLDGTTKASSAEQGAGNKVYYITSIGTDTTRALSISATDKVGGTSTVSADIPTVAVDFNWNPDLHSWRFGGVAEDADCFRCSLVAKFDDTVTVNGNDVWHKGNLPITDFVTERGTSGIWKYEKWNSGKICMWTNSISHTIQFEKLNDNMY